MADDQYRREYSQQSQLEDQKRYNYPAPEEIKAEGDLRRPNMSTSAALPSMHDPRAGGYTNAPPPSSRGGYGPDPRYASPNSLNGYPPPPGQHPHNANYHPQMPPQPDGRPSAYAPDPRGGYYDDRRPPQYHEQYPPEAYYYRGQGQMPPNPYPRDYHGPPPGSYPPEYQPGGQSVSQAAPRQRTSIACRYCRKRKIRCSGYQSAPGGKCQNCARMNQECIFQPVSSSSTTAFIPVSAVPGGVPPGTQLFGAYGQPLAPNSVPGGHPYPSSGGPHPGYYAPSQSPTDAYPPYADFRGGDDRRQREADEHWRRSHPRPAMIDEEPRRKSPGEQSSNSSPGGMNYPQQPVRQSPHGPAAATVARHQGGKSPVAPNNASGASTPAGQQSQPATGGAQQGAPTSVMSLSNLVDKSDIDRSMIGRLNRPRDGPGSSGQ